MFFCLCVFLISNTLCILMSERLGKRLFKYIFHLYVAVFICLFGCWLGVFFLLNSSLSIIFCASHPCFFSVSTIYVRLFIYLFFHLIFFLIKYIIEYIMYIFLYLIFHQKVFFNIFIYNMFLHENSDLDHL